MIIILLQRRNRYEMQNALYLKISFDVCPILEWIKKNPAEDNLLKKKIHCSAFRLKRKISALLVSWEKKVLPLRNLPLPTP